MMDCKSLPEERTMTLNDPRKIYSHATNASSNATGSVLHVRYKGTSRDIALDILEVESGTADEQIKRAVAAFLDINLDELRLLVIERHENGNLTMRPPAVFG